MWRTCRSGSPAGAAFRRERAVPDPALLGPLEWVLPERPLTGWLGHFLIGGIFWAVPFGLAAPQFPRPLWWTGIMYALGLWLVVMLAGMPLAGAGAFGLRHGAAVPFGMFALHLAYGGLLGAFYSWAI